MATPSSKHAADRSTTPGGVRAALLDAARTLFTARTFKEVTVREIARVAGANPAMINYYFDGKQGLYEALMAESITPLFEALERGRDAASVTNPAELLHRQVGLLAANPWLPNLVVREVLYGQEAFRDVYIERFAKRLAHGLLQAIPGDDAGKGTAGSHDPRLRVLAFLALSVFPFLARPVVERALGLQVDDAFTEDWSAFLVELLDLSGPRPGPAT